MLTTQPGHIIASKRAYMLLIGCAHSFKKCNNFSYLQGGEKYIEEFVRASMGKKTKTLLGHSNVNEDKVDWKYVQKQFLKLNYGIIKEKIRNAN